MQDPSNIGFGLSGVAPEASLYMVRTFGAHLNTSKCLTSRETCGLPYPVTANSKIHHSTKFSVVRMSTLLMTSS